MLPEVEHVDVVARTHHEAHVVLDEQDAEAVGRELAQQRAELVGLVLVEPGRRLVEQQHPRLARERARHLDQPRVPVGSVSTRSSATAPQPDALDQLVGDVPGVEPLP